jgi:multiple sugar transport system substrate-binding protein
VPSQTTPELLFYRKDLVREAGLEPPATATLLIAAARSTARPVAGALRHRLECRARHGAGPHLHDDLRRFRPAVLDLPQEAGGYDGRPAGSRDYRPMIDTTGRWRRRIPDGLLDYSPPDILSMSWYERVRPYAAGKVAMAYGYTLLAPYFELDPILARLRQDRLPAASGRTRS